MPNVTDWKLSDLKSGNRITVSGKLTVGMVRSKLFTGIVNRNETGCIRANKNGRPKAFSMFLMIFRRYYHTRPGLPVFFGFLRTTRQKAEKAPKG